MNLERPGAALREGHIGLASCRERVEAAGGTTAIDSAPGSGTRISITLPDVQEPEASTAPTPAPAPEAELAGAR